MNDLAMELVRLCQHNRDGSHATQANRRRGLTAMANDLYELGYRPAGAHSLKPKHVTALVTHWQSQNLGNATIKNRVGWIRWWAEKVDKASVIPRDNADLGIADRRAPTENRAWQLPPVVRLPSPHMRMSLRLMETFGLRLEESLKLKPHQADGGAVLKLQGSWTKGGRPREILIVTLEQRALLDAAKLLAGKGSLIPADKSYIQHRKAFEHQTLKHGLTNLHGLRHGYAQRRYRALTGWNCPLAGGPKRTDLTEDQRHIDAFARTVISEELGHSRLEITKVYLGG
jgi:site-specific recombinase XerC